jgi:hypothetical protein
VPGQAGDGAEDEHLVQLRGAAVDRAADEVRVVALEVDRRHHVAAADEPAEAGGDALDLLLHPVGERLRHLLAPRALGHVRVRPQRLLARRLARRVEPAVLADEQERVRRHDPRG